jgi:hypothetical protein
MDAVNDAADDVDRAAANGSGRFPRGIQGHVPAAKRKMRSRISSGRQLFIDGDPNSAWSRRYHDLLIGHISDAGGMELVSEAQLSIIRRATAMECEIERLEAKLSRGENVDLDVFGRAASHLRRLFEAIGIERRAKDITEPTRYMAVEYENT